jgi:anti-anti-sigma regulatory factor
MDITVLQYHGRVLVALLRLAGQLDGTSYLDVIAKARKVYADGARHIVVDLAGVTHLSSAGLVALHYTATLLRGEVPPDPAAGWQALGALAEDLDRGIERQIRLLNPQPQVERALERSGVLAVFEVATDLDAAIAAFSPVPVSSRQPARELRYLKAINPSLRVGRDTPVLPC